MRSTLFTLLLALVPIAVRADSPIRFEDATAGAGIADALAGLMGHGGAFGDYDGDVDVDLFVDTLGSFVEDPETIARAREVVAAGGGDADITAASVNVVASAGTADDFETFVARSTATDQSPNEQLRYLYALSGFPEETLRARCEGDRGQVHRDQQSTAGPGPRRHWRVRRQRSRHRREVPPGCVRSMRPRLRGRQRGLQCTGSGR